MSCCHETGCRRKEPLRLYRGITRRWYIATRSKDGAATEKHALPDDTQAQLDEMSDAHAWLTAVAEAAGGRQAILDGLGLELKRTTPDRTTP